MRKISSNRISDRLLDILNYETDDYFLNITIKPFISKKLLSYQHTHVFNLVYALRYNQVILDGSDTGVGKTYTAIATCKQMRLKPFIICPKTIIRTWQLVCEYFKVYPLAIVNYETVKLGKQYDRFGNRCNSEYIEVIDDGRTEHKYRWNLPRYSVIIFDEAHKCKNKTSQNAELLLSTKQPARYTRNKNKVNKVMMLSATISDTPSSFHIFGYMLGLYKNMRRARNWINGAIRDDKNKISMIPELSTINKSIYPYKGARIRIAELHDFPKNQISADCYNIDNEHIDVVNNTFEYIIKCKKGNHLGELMKARQKIELIKVDIIENLINEYRENGYSVVVFVNFNKTLNILAKKFRTTCVVRGKQSLDVRVKNIEKFQNNETDLIILNMTAGSLGISLHDEHGIPRVSIISPSFSSTTLIQALGRIYRAGSKSVAIQRIVYMAHTVEEIICNRLKDKLQFLSELNDNDLIDISNF
uniref:DEAD/SNF2-like helicase n=1 Tax=Mimivirus LCMiAC01 TaxID=2506608 RepID=A0A481YZ13_9VIRU|nr:MAG: DEAD/SNF2-like helicase [Mimivirus LCMiAC01]